MNQVAKIEDTETQPVADPMVAMIERVVLNPNADIEKLEAMLALRERLEDREARRSFDRAIADAKSEIGPIIKDGTVDYTNKQGDRTYFKHETLDGIARVVDPVLSANGLSYRFRSSQSDGMLHVTCIVAHRDGHCEETTLQGSPDTSGSKNNYQAVGSSATYLQRYTLKLALGLSAAKDDDASGADTQESVSADQFVTLRDLIEETGADLIKFNIAYGRPGDADLQTFPASKFEAAKTQLSRKKGRIK